MTYFINQLFVGFEIWQVPNCKEYGQVIADTTREFYSLQSIQEWASEYIGDTAFTLNYIGGNSVRVAIANLNA